MKNSKHTPGPWVANAYKNTNKCFVRSAYVDGMSDILFEQQTDETNMISPDARLIAAAPELLEALERLVNEAVERSLRETETPSYLMAQNAINKAKRGDK